LLRIIAVGSACLMLGACSFLQSKSGLGPTDVPFSWVQATPSSEKVWPDAGWWSEFGSAELTGLVAEAQASNLDLAIARARVEQADAQARIVGSSLLPTISARGGANENGSLDTAAGKVRTLSANVNVSYELDFWGRNAANARAADQSLRSSVYDQETVALTTVAEAAAASTLSPLLATESSAELIHVVLRAATYLATCPLRGTPRSLPSEEPNPSQRPLPLLPCRSSADGMARSTRSATRRPSHVSRPSQILPSSSLTQKT
jgi:hypothetical protein